MFKIGIDLGGTKIEGVILDPENIEVGRKRIETEQDKGYDRILENISRLYHNLSEKIAYQPHTFGIGTPGSISTRTGLLKNSNTVCMNGKPLKQDLEKMLGRAIAIQNDANCFAMAEGQMGAGKGKHLVFGVIMGSGCGGGIVYKGEVFTGQQSIAGEWGHVTIDPHNGPQCYCGKKGCIETYISGVGLEKLYYSRFGEKKGLADIVAAGRGGSEKDKVFLNEFYENFGIALSNLINILDPDIVVLGGGLSNIEELYSSGVDKVRKYIFNDELKTPIVKNLLGDSAGVLGAAFIGI